MSTAQTAMEDFVIGVQVDALDYGLGVLPRTDDWPGRPAKRQRRCKACGEMYTEYRRGHRSRRVYYIDNHRCKAKAK